MNVSGTTSGRVSCAHPHASARPSANTNAEIRHWELARASGLVRGFWTKAEVRDTGDGGAFVFATFHWPDKNVDIPVVVLHVDGNTSWGVSFSKYASFAHAAGCPSDILDLARYPNRAHYHKVELLDMVKAQLCGRHSWLYFEEFSPWGVFPLSEAYMQFAADGSYVCPVLPGLLNRLRGKA